MNLTDPDEIKRLGLSEEEKCSRNRRKNGWNVFYSRFSVDLKHLPYESVKGLVAAENLRGGPTPSIRSRTEGAASSSHSQLPVSFSEGGGWYGTFLFIFKFTDTCFFINLPRFHFRHRREGTC